MGKTQHVQVQQAVLIGTGGDIIRDILERSGCRIHVGVSILSEIL